MTTTTDLNAYERACVRFERVTLDYPRARREAERILAAAEAEYDAADAELARYETKRGIPLPEYRAGYHEHWRPGQPLVKHVHAAGRTPHEHAPEATS